MSTFSSFSNRSVDAENEYAFTIISPSSLEAWLCFTWNIILAAAVSAYPCLSSHLSMSSPSTLFLVHSSANLHDRKMEKLFL